MVVMERLLGEVGVEEVMVVVVKRVRGGIIRELTDHKKL